MDSFGYWAGLILASGLGFLLFAAGLWLIATWIGETREQKNRIRLFKARQVIGRDFLNAAEWFSECEVTYKLLKEIGERQIRYGAIDADQLREDWRRNREVSKGSKAISSSN